MKIEAELIEMFKFTMRNRSSCLGQYYPEDDWSITCYSVTLEDLQIKVAEEIIDTRIYGENPQLTQSTVLQYGEHQFDLEETERPANITGTEFLAQVRNTEHYKMLDMIREKVALQNIEREDHQRQEKLKSAEKAELARLKAKYES